WIRLAILTSTQGRRGDVFRRFAADEKLRVSAEGKLMLNALAVQIGAANQANELADCLAAMNQLPAADGRELMASLMSKLPPQSRERITKAGKSGELFKELLA